MIKIPAISRRFLIAIANVVGSSLISSERDEGEGGREGQNSVEEPATLSAIVRPGMP